MVGGQRPSKKRRNGSVQSSDSKAEEDLIAVWKIPDAKKKGTQCTLYFTVQSDVTRGKGHHLGNSKFQLHIRKKNLMKVVKHWKGFPRKDVKSSYLKVCRTQLDMTLSK